VGNCFENNGTVILEKIRKQVNFWNRFNLSLPGRINVAKSFMYSQINYLGCFLPLSDEVIKEMSTVIEKFVRGKLHIGIQKLYDAPMDGGLGLFKVKEFLETQCCAWVKRAYNCDELWKKELRYYSNNSVFNLRKKFFTRI